jgi:hypothetical protein
MAMKKQVKVKVRTQKSSMKKSLPAMGTDCFDSCKGQCTKGTPCSTG